MRRDRYIKRWLFAGLLAVALLPACSLIHDDDLDCQLYTEDGVPYAYVSIAINAATATPGTRAEGDEGGNPTGGEGGDGEEAGQDYENQVNDLTLFFYEATEDVTGVNAAATTPIVASRYFQIGEFTHSGTNAQTQAVAVEELLVNHQYHVLAVINGGENFASDLQKAETGLTLGDLQQATVTTLYTNTDNSYSNFLMASADDENPPLSIEPSNSETNPATTTIYVERVTARVDYRAVGPDGIDKEGIYEVERESGKDQVKITRAMLVNTLNKDQKCFLLKRVTEANADVSGNIVYLGDEEVDSEGDASNYVIEPTTLNKEEDDESMRLLYDNYFNDIDYDNINSWTGFLSEGVEVVEPGETGWKWIGYPKENTAKESSHYYTTGIVFEADYQPVGMGDDDTFFEWNEHIYQTAEEVMMDFDSQGWERIQGTWESINTWDDLKKDMIDMIEDDPTGYCAFLKEKYEARGETFAKENLKWSAYMENECYYKNEEGVVSIDMNREDGATRAALAPFGLATYKKGICYYTYWIKHANDQDDANDKIGGGTMEYGIVRNNVYKLEVTGISQLGNDIPGDRTLEINVSVENWRPLPSENVDLQ